MLKGKPIPKKALASSSSSESESDSETDASDIDTDDFLSELSDSDPDSDFDDSNSDIEDFVSVIGKKERSQFRTRKLGRLQEKQNLLPKKKRKPLPKRNTIFQPENSVQGRVGELASKFQSKERGFEPDDFNKMFNSSFPAFDSASNGKFLQQKAFLSSSNSAKDKANAASRVVREMEEMEGRSEKAVQILSKNNNQGFRRILRAKRKPNIPKPFRDQLKVELNSVNKGRKDEIDDDLLGQLMLANTAFQVPNEIVGPVKKESRKRKQTFDVEGMGMTSDKIRESMDGIGFVSRKKRKTEKELDPDFED